MAALSFFPSAEESNTPPNPLALRGHFAKGERKRKEYEEREKKKKERK